MSFEYGDPADSDKDHVRFLVGDTDEDHALLSDEEITFLILQEGNVYWAASAAAEACGAKIAQRVSNSLEGASAQESDMFRHYRELARTLRLEAQKKGGSVTKYTGLTTATGDERDPYFTVGMHDNIAGSQDDNLTSPLA